MSNELVIKPAFRLGAIVAQPTGLAARKAALAQAASVALPVDPSTLEHRIGIVFDNSGSMYGFIDQAKEGCEEFLRSCPKDITAVAVYPMQGEVIRLCSNLPAVALMVKNIKVEGSTPLVETCNTMLAQNKLTRAIVFSDGAPNSFASGQYEKLIKAGIVIDTVFIGNSWDAAAKAFLSKLAEDTDGKYLEFVQGKSNFKTAFKYLSPGLRYMLADSSFVTKLEGK